MSANDYVRLMKNLLSNAIKYSNEDSSVIIKQYTEKNNIIVTVKDNGIGIPKKDLDKIGQRFFRASNTGEISGTGLGLAIVVKILNTYGGSINIDSKSNKGTEVTVNLPT
jgi:two-component system sensor histidine kinase VicK